MVGDRYTTPILNRHQSPVRDPDEVPTLRPEGKEVYMIERSLHGKTQQMLPYGRRVCLFTTGNVAP